MNPNINMCKVNDGVSSVIEGVLIRLLSDTF